MRILIHTFFLLILVSLCRADDFPRPEWIRFMEEADAKVTLQLKDISPDAEIIFKVAGDFAGFVVTLDGKPVAEADPYDPPAEFFLPKHTPDQDRVVEILVDPVEGPSAIAARLTILEKSREPRHYLTGTTGEFSGSPFRGAGKVTPERWAGNRLEEISAFAEYNQWKEASGGDPKEDILSTLTFVPDGFEAECLRIAEEDEDSWVNLELDSSGRILIAKEQKGILRMTPDETGRIEKVETVNEDLEECRGLLWSSKNTLFANANDSKALYRLMDTSGDDSFDEVTLLRSTVGGSGHGRNDLAEDSTGAIHIIHGDSIEVPEKADRHTLSETGAPRELGHWIRTDKKGKSWEILARGLRNPYGIAFNPDGEAFTYDADNEGDVGLPFYRPTRINHLVSGANYGWHQERENTRNMTVYAPDSWPTTYDVGRGSPTAVKFGTGSQFPDTYKKALFALDWAYGRILAVHLTPRGSSYYGSGEVFMEGRPLNVTDLDFAADGSMLFITGGRKTKSALFRVRYTGPRAETPAITDQEQDREAFSTEARSQRRALEKFHHSTESQPEEIVWTELKNPDPWIRNAARVALEFSPVDTWRERALSGGNLTALLALSRQGSEKDRKTILQKLTSFTPADLVKSERLIFLRICEISLRDETPLKNPAREHLINSIESLLPSPSAAVSKEACRILALLEAPSSVDHCLKQFSKADSQLDALHYLEVLSGIEQPWATDQRRRFFRHLGYAKHFSFGDRFMAPFFEGLEKEALSYIADEKTREEMAILLAEHNQKPAPPVDQESRPFVRNWTLDDFPDEVLNSADDEDSPADGKALFSAALCNRCHVCGDTGFPSGPDLTRVGSRFSRRDLLASIIEPSRVVAEVHRNHVVIKKDGTTTMGRIVRDDFRKSLLYLSPNPFDPGEQVEINKADIDSFTESPVSPMPPALLNSLTETEVLTLLKWIEAGGNTPKNRN